MEPLTAISEQYLDGIITAEEYKEELNKTISEMDDFSLVVLAQIILGEA